MGIKHKMVGWLILILISLLCFGNYSPELLASGIDRSSEIVLTWSAEPNLATSNSANQAQDLLLAQEKFDLNEMPGLPSLPVKRLLIELPLNTDVSVNLIKHLEKPIGLEQPFSIGKAPSGVLFSEEGELLGGAFHDVNGTPGIDFNAVEFEEIGTMAGTRYGRLTFYPLRPSSNGETASLTTHIQVELVYTPQQTKRNESRTLLGPLLTPDLILETSAVGLTQLTYADLVESGLDLDRLSPHQLELQYKGEVIPLYFEGDADQVFEAGERFLFYVSDFKSRWTKKRILTLSHLDNGTATRMLEHTPASGNGEADGQLQKRLILEQDVIYTPNCYCGPLPAGRDGDRWVWQELSLPGNHTSTIEFELNDFDAARPSEVTFWMIGFTEQVQKDDHGVSVSLNGVDLGDLLWDGKTAHQASLTVPSNVLQQSNQLTLSLGMGAGTIDGIWVDAVEITYSVGSTQLNLGSQAFWQAKAGDGEFVVTQQVAERLWGIDVTDPAAPVLFRPGTSQTGDFRIARSDLQPSSYAFSYESDLLSPDSIRPPNDISQAQGDYIIVAPEAFHGALRPLIDLRERENWDVVLASLEGIYDHYGYGQPEPDSIHNYLLDAYQNWEIRPKAVLLVGDGTYDPKQNQPDGKPTILPVPLAFVDPWAGEIGADNRLAMLDGEDVLPDVSLGRLPVNSVQELDTVISKIFTYQQANAALRNQFSFVSDDNDTAGDFSRIVTEVAPLLESSGYETERVQFVQNQDNLESVKGQVQSILHEGRGHVLFSGHSTVHQWALESFFHISGVEELGNRSQFPIILQMTCFTGTFLLPGLDSLDEALLRQPAGGAIAVWGATGLGVATGHEELASGYFEKFLNDSDTYIGEAILAGKLQMLAHKPQHADLIDSFTLLGDPALSFSPTEKGSFSIFLPLVTR